MKMNATFATDAAGRQAAEDAVPLRNWYALTIMTLIYSCHFLDRSMISIIVEPVRAEFKLSDGQIGLLTGLAYGGMFALAGIPLGLLIDRTNRVKLLSLIVAVWSAMTTLSGVAQNYVQLIFARMGVGAAEAGGSPTSLSLISDLFPPSKRSTAVGCFFLSNAVGATLSVLIGGVITAKYGWRSAMLIAGAPGLALAIVAFTTIREPARGATDPTRQSVKAAGLLAAVRYIGNDAAMLHLLAGISLLTAGVATLGAWLPAFAMRFHGLSIKEAGLVAAIAVGFCGALGSVLGGVLSDRLSASRARRRMDFCVGVCALAVVIAVSGMLIGNTPVSLSLSCLTMLAVFAAYPASFGAMLGLAGPGMRGVTSACMQICSNLIGYGLGPFVVGLLSDRFGGPESLRYAMATVMLVCFPWAAVHFSLSARAVSRSRSNT